ncbi:response regulator transcription factor [Cohnella sp. WQ 127256]|uniref:response regulator transcription factor n=1 Tax=Cohnella sp. WQ 127256 TaxID=2938790 RepID=UPI0021197481|nr:response regulator transcription factor [Cohnella sp. WQ 127256]
MKKVILVDDEIFARKGLMVLIPWEKYGYEIIGEADDGEEALHLIEQLAPDLVITDIRMPVLDGLELIQTVRKRNGKSTKFIIVSGYGDFKYAQHAVRFGVQDYLLKPIDEIELIDTLERIAKEIDSTPGWSQVDNRVIQASMFEKLLSGQMDDKGLSEAAQSLGLPKDKPLRYFALELNDAPTALNEAERVKRVEQAKEAAEAILARHIQGKEPFLYARSLSELGFLAFVTGAEGAGRLAEELVRTVSGKIEGVLRVYVGEVSPSLALIRNSYLTALDAMEHKYVFDTKNVTLHEETKSVVLQVKEIEPAIYSGLIESLELHDGDKMLMFVTRMFAAFQEQSYSPESITASISRCVHGITRVIQTMLGNESAIGTLKPIMHWHHEPRTLQGIKRLFVDFLSECADYITALRSSKGKGEIGKIKQYIEIHYNENMSLKSISKRFYMNPVYLGQLFKKTYGVYFNEFLLHIRIDEAKKQLRQTNQKVYEIAANVGFGNADYFVSQFEKVEGKTPTEYKNAMIAKV